MNLNAYLPQTYLEAFEKVFAPGLFFLSGNGVIWIKSNLEIQGPYLNGVMAGYFFSVMSSASFTLTFLPSTYAVMKASL